MLKLSIIVVLTVIAVSTAVPYERELTPNAHALPEYALKRVPTAEHKNEPTDTSDLKTDSSLWWSPGYLYPYTYTRVYSPGYHYNPDVVYSPYYTLYR
ncbi:PREDICTED: uncharacterized protein LOC106102613 [Papilio polytes]|uniref:uncharacterized protein LOC106102613 n=1 Tax=Papilio polytes TaxID=76194 RepID=UPI000675CB73|nr:PREDICTED: uncharacterized protein LOC106102613 [Papilio polytes]